MAIATDLHVQEIGVHRAAGLESQWLIAATWLRKDAGRATMRWTAHRRRYDGMLWIVKPVTPPTYPPG
ncbi:MAG TPA: hypothetical protein VKD28_02090 [Gemmatimonadales bacterium]|nr:hypothetical protein [Gemmatimonadales bacterium]